MNIQSKNDLLNHLDAAYSQVGVAEADIIYIYPDFRFFGQSMAHFESKNEFCETIVAPLLKKGKTVIITTFSYTSHGVFEVEKTPTSLGALNKWFLQQKDFSRSEHPLFSYAALGPQKNIIENIGKAAFGKQSVFDRLLGKKTAFLHVGRPVEMGNTALHFIEQTCGATYRYSKCFHTEVYRQGKYLGTDYSAYVRRNDVPGENFSFTFEEATRLMRQKNLIKEVGQTSDLSNISFYWYDAAIEFLVDEFYKNQNLFINSNYKNYE